MIMFTWQLTCTGSFFGRGKDTGQCIEGLMEGLIKVGVNGGVEGAVC